MLIPEGFPAPRGAVFMLTSYWDEHGLRPDPPERGGGVIDFYDAKRNLVGTTHLRFGTQPIVGTVEKPPPKET